MAEDVRGHALVAKRRAACAGLLGVLGDKALDGVAAQPGTAPARERRGLRVTGALSEPGAHQPDSVAGQRCTPILAALAVATHVSTGRELDVGAAQADEFRHAQAGLETEEQERMVAPTEPGGAIGLGEDCLDLGAIECCHEPPGGAFGWDGEDTLAEASVSRLVENGEPEERVNGREPSVSCSRTVCAPLLEVIEKGADERGVDVGEEQVRGTLSQVLVGESEQEPEGVAVGRNGIRARGLLSLESRGEERLEEASEERHRPSLPARSNRAVATSSNSGTAVRYQYVVDGPMWPRYVDRVGSFASTLSPARCQRSTVCTAKVCSLCRARHNEQRRANCDGSCVPPRERGTTW